MVGRKSELEKLKQILDTDLQNSNSSICVIGEAGIGKSKLVREASLYAIKKNIRVELIGGISIYKDTPFFVLKNLADKLLRLTYAKGEAANYPVLGDLALSEREQIALEKLISPNPGAVANWDIPSDDKRRAIQGAVAAVVSKAAANSPLVLLIEDLHDVDLESALSLKYIISECAEYPLSVIITTRPQATELASSILEKHLTLEALTAEAVSYTHLTLPTKA